MRPPSKPKASELEALWQHGGYPEPFLKRDPRFSRRWQSLRTQQLLREDIRDLTRIHQLDELALLVKLLAARSGQQIVYSSLARDVRVSIDTVRRWIDTLSRLYHGFPVKPWHRNVTRSPRKEPKWLLRDWADIEDTGQRAATVDFAVIRDGKPWCLVEVKQSETSIGSSLAYFQSRTRAPFAFQVVIDMDHVNVGCFERPRGPVTVPASTFLSELL